MNITDAYQSILDLDWTKSPHIFILILSFILSRIPLLNLGFGHDGDAWLIAISALELRMAHIYRTSRFPGYPLPEYVNSLIINHGWIATNSLTMILSLVSVYFFARILKDLNAKNKGLLVLTYAFLPILWINSTNTMDFTWALTFIILTWFFVLKKQCAVAGLMMGLAIGSRITSAILIFPFFCLIWMEYKKIRDIIYFGAAAVTISSLLFLPLLLQYGLKFLTYYPVPIANVLLEVTIRFTRKFGLISTFFGIVAFLLSSKVLFKNIVEKEKIIIFLLFNVVLVVILFIKAPFAAEYLIPAIPFGLLLLNRICRREFLVVLCILLLLHSFVFPFSYIIPGATDSGMIKKNIEDRTAQTKFIYDLVRTEVENHSVVIVGWQLSQLQALLLLSYLDENVSYNSRYGEHAVGNYEKDIWYRFLLPFNKLQDLLSRGYTIYYTPSRLRVITIRVYGYDLKDYAVCLEVGQK